MTNADRTLMLQKLAAAAFAGGHVWPEYAACEVVVETGWLSSASSQQGNNLFGCKQHSHPIFQTANLPTCEFLDGHWIAINAAFIVYPSWADSFADRMNTLRRLAPQYPHYAAALAATTGEQYVSEVSKSWSTDPNRAETANEIHGAHFPSQAVA